MKLGRRTGSPIGWGGTQGPHGRSLRFALAAVLASWVVACTSSSPRSAAQEPPDGALPGFGGPAPDGGDAGVLVDAVTGRFLDSAGNPPAAGFEASVCGPICYISETVADGSFTVPVGSRLDLPEFSALPHGRPFFAGFYFALPAEAAGPDIALGALPLVAMPHDGAPIDLTGALAQTLASGPATLTLDAGVQLKLEFEDVAAMSDGSQFRAAAVDPKTMGDYAPADASLLVALGPFESYSVDATGTLLPARILFDNTPMLAAGTAVQFLALGTYLHPDWIPPAHFTEVATGTVSSDGKSIELDDGLGFRYLTWVAILPKDAS